MNFIKVVLLGESRVGKTSIVQRFVRNDFSEKYIPTQKKETYYPSFIIKNHMYGVKISDIPVISYFPLNSYQEWSHFRFYGLRSATAYILVFDLSNMDTFQYVRSIREQMLESRDMKNVPIIVVGNKLDLAEEDRNAGLVVSTSNNGISSNDVDPNHRKRRDIINLVKKHWKCSYVECSAKYNWGVVAVFKELMEVIDSIDSNKDDNEEDDTSPVVDNIHDPVGSNKKCVIL